MSLQARIRFRVLVAACLLLTTSGCESGAGGEESTVSAVRAMPVTAAVAEQRDFQIWETAVGQLEAITAPMIAAEVSGQIVTIATDVGHSVEAGQLLAEVDPQDFLLARSLALADIDRLRALMRAQNLTVGRLDALVKKQSGS